MAKTTFRQKVGLGWGKLKTTAGNVYTDVTAHWSKPAKGNYVSYKELVNYSVGGMGQNMIAYLMGYLALGVGNTLLASTIGIRPMHLQVMATVQTVLNLFFYVIRGKLVDNTRTKWGRFRPYIAIMGAPLAVLSTVFIFLPFETMTYTQKLVATFCFAIAISMISPLLTDTYGELGSCISPNTKERTLIFTASSIIYSVAPTVYNFLVPLLSPLTGGFTNINTYKYIVVPIGIVGIGLSLFTAFGCKERVVTSKSYVQKVGLWEGCVAVWKNKYWWLRTLAGLVGFLEGANGVLFSWIYIYGTQDMTTYAFLVTLQGTASGIAMLVTPFLLGKMGNRSILLFHNAVNIVFVAGMLVSYRVPGLFFLFLYLNTLINMLSIVYNPVMAAEVKDSIQYQSGKRLDFTLGAAGMITMPITILTGYALPFIYESMGLTVNYNVLYDPLIRNNMFYVLCILSIVGAALNLIPFFFYNLSREKHRIIILSLRYRAANSDYANGALTPQAVKEVVELYNEAMEYHEAPMPDFKALKAEIKRSAAIDVKLLAAADGRWGDADQPLREEILYDAKRARKTQIKEARKAYAAAKKLKEYKESVEEVFLPEKTKYENPAMIAQVRIADAVAAAGVNGVASMRTDEIATDYGAESCDQKTNCKIQKQIAQSFRKLEKMQRNISKRYPDGVQEDYLQRLKDALDLSVTTKEEKKQANRKIKACEKDLKRYNSVYKFFNECKELSESAKACNHYEDFIVPMYEEACAEVARLDAIEEEKERAAKETKAAELAAIKQRRKEKKEQRKNKKKGGNSETDDRNGGKL